MPSTRRTFLASALAVGAAGCTELGSSDGSAPTDEPEFGTATPGDAAPDAPEYAAWSRELSDRLGLVALGGGPETPSVFVASAAAGDRTSNDHALWALTLQDGARRWRLGVADPVRTRPRYLEAGDRSLLVLTTGRASGDSVVHAVDPEARERAWRFDADTHPVPMDADDGTVFVGSRDGEPDEDGAFVAALDGAAGTERWRTETGDVARTGHRAYRGLLFADTARRLRALDVAGGETAWSVTAESHAYDNRAERVFVQDGDVVRGLSHGAGEELWRRAFEFAVSRVTSPRAAADETVLVGDSGGRLLALSPLDGGTRWTLPVGRDEGFRPTVDRTSERLYVGGAGVHAVDPVSGERAWAFEPDVGGRVDVEAGAPATVFAYTDRRVWALAPGSGDVRWEFEPGTELAGVETAGELAFVGVDGSVYALDGSESAVS